MSFVGDITDALGLTDHEGEEKAAKNAAMQSERSYALTKEQIAFQREQYQDWKNIYGDIQENLGKYYNDLGADNIMALGLENQQREYQAVKKEIDRDFIQRGIDPNSPLATATAANLGFQNAEARAKIRTEAPAAAAKEKLGFLGVGLGQGTAMLGMLNNAYQSGAGNAAGLTNSYLNQQTQLSVQNSNTMNDLVGYATGRFVE